MKKKNSDRIFVSLRNILKLLLVHSVIVIYVAIGGYLIIDLFTTRKQETISLTYYGFAIFGIFSNICFSYARSCDEKNDQAYLRNVGERFLFSATGFLIGSLLNYISINSTSLFKRLSISSAISSTCEFVGGLFFVTSFFFAALTIHSLLGHLFEKVMLNKDNYYNKK